MTPQRGPTKLRHRSPKKRSGQRSMRAASRSARPASGTVGSGKSSSRNWSGARSLPRARAHAQAAPNIRSTMCAFRQHSAAESGRGPIMSAPLEIVLEHPIEIGAVRYERLAVVNPTAFHMNWQVRDEPDGGHIVGRAKSTRLTHETVIVTARQRSSILAARWVPIIRRSDRCEFNTKKPRQ